MEMKKVLNHIFDCDLFRKPSTRTRCMIFLRQKKPKSFLFQQRKSERIRSYGFVQCNLKNDEQIFFKQGNVFENLGTTTDTRGVKLLN